MSPDTGYGPNSDGSDPAAPEALRAYARDSVLAAAMLAPYEARVGAGLTQADVAARMSTTQSAIARWEHDLSRGISLRRYVDWAMACGLAVEPFRYRPLSSIALPGGFVGPEQMADLWTMPAGLSRPSHPQTP